MRRSWLTRVPEIEVGNVMDVVRLAKYVELGVGPVGKGGSRRGVTLVLLVSFTILVVDVFGLTEPWIERANRLNSTRMDSIRRITSLLKR